jgi:predicted glutamine amidotransferase
MCEIAILGTGDNSTAELFDAAQTIYSAMQDSLGVVALHDRGDTFEYSYGKWVEPEWDRVTQFIDTHYHDAAVFFIHGRLATTGEVTTDNAHPLEIECDECDVDLLMHNGVMRAWQQEKSRHEAAGCHYATDVDSEVIAHQYGGVPENYEDWDTPQYPNQPAYIMLNEKRAYIRSSKRYQLRGDGRMAQSRRSFGPNYTTDEPNYGRVLLFPSAEVDDE